MMIGARGTGPLMDSGLLLVSFALEASHTAPSAEFSHRQCRIGWIGSAASSGPMTEQCAIPPCHTTIWQLHTGRQGWIPRPLRLLLLCGLTAGDSTTSAPRAGS